jgi:hypothetical protein
VVLNRCAASFCEERRKALNRRMIIWEITQSISVRIAAEYMTLTGLLYNYEYFCGKGFS